MIPNAVVACVPVNREIPYTPPADSMTIACRQCGTWVWLGPEGQKKAVEGVPVWCMPCVVIRQQRDKVKPHVVVLRNP